MGEAMLFPGEARTPTAPSRSARCASRRASRRARPVKVAVRPEAWNLRSAGGAPCARPAETVFIDDSAANVEAARAFGWQAIHCTAPDMLPAQLARYLPVSTTLSASKPRLRA
jgi:hypothetical protein